MGKSSRDKGALSLVRVPTIYALHRTDTGRIASGSTGIEKEGVSSRGGLQQMQNFPKKIRDIFVARPGYKLLGADWAGIEWAITMHDCARLNVPTGFHEDLLSRFRAGTFDPHTHLASAAYGVSPEDVTHDQRESVKPFTHGRTYGGAARELGKRARITPERSLAYALDKRIIIEGRCTQCRSNPRDTLLHVRNQHNGFRQQIYEMICDVHEEAFRVGYWQNLLIETVKKRHYVETPLGWRRYFWGWNPKPSEVFATRIQATASDLMKWTLARMFCMEDDGSYILPYRSGQRSRYNPEWLMWTTTHDSVLLEIPASDEAEASEWLLDSMQQPIPWLGNRSFRAEVKGGDTWKEVS